MSVWCLRLQCVLNITDLGVKNMMWMLICHSDPIHNLYVSKKMSKYNIKKTPI